MNSDISVIETFLNYQLTTFLCLSLTAVAANTMQGENTVVKELLFVLKYTHSVLCGLVVNVPGYYYAGPGSNLAWGSQRSAHPAVRLPFWADQ